MLSEARAAFKLSAEDEYTRQLILREKGVIAQAAVDDAKTAATRRSRRWRRWSPWLVAELPARPEEIAAAERNVAAEESAVAEAKIELDRREIFLPHPPP